MFGTGHAGIGDDHRLAQEFLASGAEERSEVGAADFLFAFDEEGEVAGELGAGAKEGFDGFEVGEVLAFVVAGTAGEQGIAVAPGFKRGGGPQLERFGWLHVVVAVHQEVGAFAGAPWSAGEDDGMPGGGTDFGVESQGSGVVSEPLGAGLEVNGVAGLGADGWEAQMGAEVLDELGFVIGEVLFDGWVHGWVVGEGR
jgi:hypothetical protein